VVSSIAENLTMTFDDAKDAADFLVRTAGHVIAERQRLTADGRWDDLIAVMKKLADDRGQHKTGRLDLDFAYLTVTATHA
jgi:hypothetical protein